MELRKEGRRQGRRKEGKEREREGGTRYERIILPVQIWFIDTSNVWSGTFDVQGARTHKSKYSNNKTHPGRISQV